MNISKFKIRNLTKYFRYIIKQDKPIKTIVAYILVLTRLCNFIKIKKEGYKLNFYPTSLSMINFIDNKSRKDDDKILESYLKNGSIFVDAGANIGTLALKASSLVGSKGKVYAIEAHPRTFKYLEGNFKINSFENYTLINCALGDENGFIEFSDINSDDENYVTTQNNGIKVKLKRLDDIIDPGKIIDLLKIDVEGFELFVLKGSINTLKNTRVVLLEIFERNFNRYDYQTKDVLEFMKHQGFLLYKKSGDDLEEINSEYKTEKVENIICKRD